MVIKRFDPLFIILNFDLSQQCVITFMPHYISSQFHFVLSDHPKIQACFVFVKPNSLQRNLSSWHCQTHTSLRLCPNVRHAQRDNGTNPLNMARVYECRDRQSEISPTFTKSGGHIQGPKISSWHSWKKYGCGVLSDILHPCRFLQMGFSPQTFWPLESGGGVWSHEHPWKSKPRRVFVFGPVSSCFDWFACVPTMKMSSYFT